MEIHPSEQGIWGAAFAAAFVHVYVDTNWRITPEIAGARAREAADTAVLGYRKTQNVLTVKSAAPFGAVTATPWSEIEERTARASHIGGTDGMIDAALATLDREREAIARQSIVHRMMCTDLQEIQRLCDGLSRSVSSNVAADVRGIIARANHALHAGLGDPRAAR